MKKYQIASALIGGAALLAVALPAFAQTASVSVSAAASSSARAALKAKLSTASLPTIIAKADEAITARESDLNDLSAKVNAMVKVSASEKSSISTEVQTEIASLTTLKAKIDADTSVADLKADAKTITGDYRIYMLVIPQGRILVAADRANTIAGLMNALGTKIQARITADQTAGKNVASLQSTYADFTAKVADSGTQASLAVSAVASLTPDQGNAAVAASNHTALLKGRVDIKASATDLQAARADIKTILAGLKSE